MTPKSFLSDKKTSNLNISISPALKDWIQRFVKRKNEENPNDARYKSTSTFICSIMENTLKIFEKGKTLDDYDKVMDQEITDFYDQFSVSMLGPFVEPNCELNKYSPIDYGSNLQYFFGMRSFYMKSIDPYDIKSIKLWFERVKKRYLYGKLTKDINWEIFTDPGGNHFKVVLEHIGFYKNIHFYNAKLIAAVLGIFGFKVTNFSFSDDEIYYRMDLSTTELFFHKKLYKNERIKLMESNIKILINYDRLLDEKPEYLWIRYAQDGNLYINFKNVIAFNNWIDLIEKDLQKHGDKELFPLKMLKFFEKIHWINILDYESLSFQFNLSDKENKREIEFLLMYFSKFNKVISDSGYYYLEPFNKENNTLIAF